MKSANSWSSEDNFLPEDGFSPGGVWVFSESSFRLRVGDSGLASASGLRFWLEGDPGGVVEGGWLGWLGGIGVPGPVLGFMIQWMLW